MSEAPTPVAHTVLPLLERLAKTALAERPTARPYRLAGLRLEPGAITLRLALRGVASLVDGEYPLRLVIRESTPERTWCDIDLPSAPGLGRFVGLGLKALPRNWLNDALGRLFGGAVVVQGERVVLEHQALLRYLAGAKGEGE